MTDVEDDRLGQEFEEYRDALYLFAKNNPSIEKVYRDFVQEGKRQVDFSKGVVIGLVFGIMGNLFIQFFFQVVEGVILAKYDTFFLTSVAITAFSVIIITFFALRNWKQYRLYNKHLIRLQESHDDLAKAFHPFHVALEEAKTGRKTHRNNSKT